MGLIVRWLLNTLALFIVVTIVPGFHYHSIATLAFAPRFIQSSSRSFTKPIPPKCAARQLPGLSQCPATTPRHSTRWLDW